MTRMSLILTVVLVAVASAGGVVVWAYNAEIDRARAGVGKGARAVQTSAGFVEYGERGTGVPLLSIHGAGGGYDQGLTNAADFVGDGFRVIAPSRFGYLGTPVPAEATPTAQADTHAALLDALNIDRAVVVGVSAGARSAIELALRHPDRVTALILIVPATYAPSNPPAIEGSHGSRLAFWFVNAGADFAWWAIEKIAPSVLIRFLGVPPEVVAVASEAEQARVRRIVKSVQPLSQRFRGINLDSIPSLQRLPIESVGVPTLVVSARDDLFSTVAAAEFTASVIPSSKLLVLSTGGHLLVGHDRYVRDAIGNFLKSAGQSPK